MSEAQLARYGEGSNRFWMSRVFRLTPTKVKQMHIKISSEKQILKIAQDVCSTSNEKIYDC